MTHFHEPLSEEFYFRQSGTGDNPWEIGRAQPAIIKLVEQAIFHGEVLDIGCGIADNAIYIATHAKNVNVTAIDLASKAIEVAREKAEKNNVKIQFEVVNMVEDLSKTNLKQHSFDIILDSAIFHAFSNDDRQRYIKSLKYLIKPGGLYIQIVFSEKEIRETRPRRIKNSDLEELFSSKNGWTIESMEDVFFELKPDAPMAPGAQAYLSLIRRN